MMKFLRKYQYRIVTFMLAGFLIYIAMGMGVTFFTSRKDVIAEVNGEKVPFRVFDSFYRREIDQTKPDDEAGRKKKQEEALRDVIQNVVFAQEAKRYGIAVPDQQVASSLAQIPAFQQKGQFDPRLYVQALRTQIRLSPQDFEEEQRKSIAFYKLRWLIQSSIKVTDQELQMMEQFQQTTKPFKDDKEKAAFRDQIWQEKVLWAFNQWFVQISQRTRVKTHLDILEGGQ